MLKLNSVEYGIQAFGRGAGSPSFAFHFIEDEEPIVQEESFFKDASQKMYEFIKAYIKDNNLQDEWDLALRGLTPMFFEGTCYSKEEYSLINDEFVHLIEKEALDYQKLLYNITRVEDGVDDKGETKYKVTGDKSKLRPPSRIYVGQGLHCYSNDFYQTMECVYINCNFEKDKDGKYTWPNDIFAVTQMAQANSCYMYFRIRDEEELKAFEELANDPQHPVGLRWKLFVFAIIDNPTLDISSLTKGNTWHRYTFDMAKILPTAHYVDLGI